MNYICSQLVTLSASWFTKYWQTLFGTHQDMPVLQAVLLRQRLLIEVND